MFEGGGGVKPTSPQYSRFLRDFSWFHIVSILANDNYLSMERVLGENVQDCFSYIQYVMARKDAEQAQIDFESKMNNKRRKK